MITSSPQYHYISEIFHSASNSNLEQHSQATKPDILAVCISYAPVCDEGNTPPQVYAAGVGQYINVTCDVVASPATVKYSWVFNNSLTSERLPGNQVFTTPDGRSMVQFMAKAHQDYGTLQCWAQNSVGRMTQPCLFTVIPAGRPERPVGCSVVNKTYDSLVVGCSPGFDGGLPQTFAAKVFEAVTGRGQANVTSNWANFTLEGLTPGLDYVINVVALNSLGSSDPVTLEAFTYKMAENRMRDEKVEEDVPALSSEAGVLMGNLVVVVVVVAVLVVVLMVVLVRCLLVRRQQEDEPADSSRRNKILAPPDHPTGSISVGEGGGAAGAHTAVTFEMADFMYGHPGQPPPPPTLSVEHEKK
ncbi:Nephrin-like 21 [Homarus americanus]|uniref:Nephrin-like 21 n=1 Tax=Homarus americanus TaxID=6706 RepID=A0A8J5MTI9_HOMAM|nr:Nephrin-like 21 [Homarus americanus]